MPEEAKLWPRRNVITRAIGIYENPELEIRSGTLEADDLFVLCSDGLTEEVDDARIAEVLAQGDCSAQECVDMLVAAALDGGGSDNITVVLVRCQ